MPAINPVYNARRTVCRCRPDCGRGITQSIVYKLKDENTDPDYRPYMAQRDPSRSPTAPTILFEGRILFQGTSEELAENPVVPIGISVAILYSIASVSMQNEAAGFFSETIDKKTNKQYYMSEENATPSRMRNRKACPVSWKKKFYK